MKRLNPTAAKISTGKLAVGQSQEVLSTKAGLQTKPTEGFGVAETTLNRHARSVKTAPAPVTFQFPYQETGTQPDFVCLSHLRWNFVFQRPQHLLSRCAKTHRVFFFEEPLFESIQAAYLEVVLDEKTNVWRCVPHVPEGLSLHETNQIQRQLLTQAMAENQIENPVLWYYTPMALNYSRNIAASAVVYDCMDELAAFAGAPAELKQCEVELLDRADVVFTGGHSIYEAKRHRHPEVYAVPSSVDVAHFAQARTIKEEPADQASIPHPRIGFFGVLDERLDIELIRSVSEKRPDWHIVLIGPVVKIDPALLPQADNIHYLGGKEYQELPHYLAGWDAALLLFARNEATRYISPTKTPEYLAAGKPVVSTSIHDVIHPYGDLELVRIADEPEEFIGAVEACLAEDWEASGTGTRVDAYLAKLSWDNTWSSMLKVVQNKFPESLPLKFQSNGEGRSIRPESKASSKPAFDYLIVGAGFAGSVVAERLASQHHKKVLIVDQRSHIAGNAYDHYDDNGILIHRYGPHIFHTNSEEVFDYLSQFTEWRPYEHEVKAQVDDKLLPIPINLDTINQYYGLNLTSEELERFFAEIAEIPEAIRTSEDVVVSKVGRELYEKFFRGYTRKQWGLDPSELDASVTARIPVRTNRDARYFTDKFQVMPRHGFTRMFEKMLDHPNIKIMLNTDYREIKNVVTYGEMIYTGPVDAYFNYQFGKLPYRSLDFKHETLETPTYQSAPVINYPNDYEYTRITEFKYLTGQHHEKTSIVYEFPKAEGDPYYPIPCPANANLYERYKHLADTTPGVHFAGRLGTYRYYNMDQVVAQSLTLFKKLTQQKELRTARKIAAAV